METTYIYALVDPRDNAVRYVGKSNRPRVRLSQHIQRSKKRNNQKNRWIQGLLKEGLKPIVTILEEVPRDGWEQHEIDTIKSFREINDDLFNVHLGGDEPPTYTDEIRKRISDSVKALHKDPEYAAKQRSHDAYRSERSREAIIEHWADPKAREKHIEGLHKAWENDERRERLSEFNRQRAQDPEFQTKHREAIKRSMTPEVRDKMSVSKKKLYADPEERRKQSERGKAWVRDNPDKAAERVRKMTEARLKWLKTEEGKTAWEKASRSRSEKMKALWADPEWRAKQMESRRAKRAARLTE